MIANARFEPMVKLDYDTVIALWHRTEGIVLNESDSRPLRTIPLP